MVEAGRWWVGWEVVAVRVEHLGAQAAGSEDVSGEG